MKDEDIGKLIRDAREEAGLTQSDVGEIVHLSRRAVGDREKGRTSLKLTEFLELQKQGVVSLEIFD
jgi:DNA-binding XRE family transcriptional regulator